MDGNNERLFISHDHPFSRPLSPKLKYMIDEIFFIFFKANLEYGNEENISAEIEKELNQEDAYLAGVVKLMFMVGITMTIVIAVVRNLSSGSSYEDSSNRYLHFFSLISLLTLFLSVTAAHIFTNLLAAIPRF